MRKFTSFLTTAAVAAAAAAATITGTTFLSVTPASASAFVCESFSAFCLSATSLTYGTEVTESGGRQLTWHESGEFCFGGTCYSAGTLDFNAGTACVVADSNTGLIYVEPCVGLPGVTWAMRLVNGHTEFINRHLTLADGSLRLLTGLADGGQYATAAVGYNGGYQKFDFQ